MYEVETIGPVSEQKRQWGQYSEETRRHYVELFKASQPISQRKFAAKYGFNRKSLMKWLREYGGPQEEKPKKTTSKKRPAARRPQKKGRKPASARPMPAETWRHAAVSPISFEAWRHAPGSPAPEEIKKPAPYLGGETGENVRTITIPYLEYMELLEFKTKFNIIREACR